MRVFLCGDIDGRVKRIAEKHGVSARKAKILVEETDARRRSYHDYYSGENWGYSGNYDLCLDEIKIGVDGVVEMVAAYVGLMGSQQQ